MNLVDSTTLTSIISCLSIGEQRQDLRSLALFRILLGCYILYDIYTRLQHGRLSLAWYTSGGVSSEQSGVSYTSFLHPHDTPHKNPIHLLWFYRGSEFCQLCLFGLTAILAFMFALGYSGGYSGGYVYSDKGNFNSYNNRFVYVTILLWLNVTAMQCRNMHVHDGSDTFSRHLLLWSIFLPMNQLWSLDSYYYSYDKDRDNDKDKCRDNKFEKYYKYKGKGHQYDYDRQQQQYQQQYQQQHIQNKIAVWGIRLQIVFMYLGTVLARTTDRCGYSYTSLFGGECECDWLPPSLSAVHYALNASFSTRDCWLGDVVRQNVYLSKFMTLSAMLIETSAPILCLDLLYECLR